ncbi:unnamed protein product [Lactuca virosa]|uniref:3-dehydroquinate synthase N-terminal domain-containing protein n=1 Tax=Lactuca virosa TaxID=75947 RepID=A0AAU9MBW6_9ASTR|nr:unnamed protein product [Lactuca virosa]
MATLSPSSPPSSPFITITGNLTTRRLIHCAVRSNCGKRISRFRSGVIVTMSMEKKKKKEVWIWTENKQVMTAAVERGWTTFIFSSIHRQLATDWSSIALINPIFIEDKSLFDNKAKLVATISEISSPQELEQLQSAYEHADNIIVDLLDWQVSWKSYNFGLSKVKAYKLLLKATGKTIPLAVGFIGQVAATNVGGLVIDMTRQIKMAGRALCLLDILVKATDENETERNIEKKYLIC